MAFDKFGRILEAGDSVLYIKGGHGSFIRLDTIKEIVSKNICIVESTGRRVMSSSLVEVNDISFELQKYKRYGEILW